MLHKPGSYTVTQLRFQLRLNQRSKQAVAVLALRLHRRAMVGHCQKHAAQVRLHSGWPVYNTPLKHGGKPARIISSSTAYVSGKWS
jgi:hypothetical protein